VSELLRFAAVTLGSVLFIVDPVAVIPNGERRTQEGRDEVAEGTAKEDVALTPLLQRIGKTGIRVVTRIMGLILAALAVQFVLSGVKEAFQL
jgi:hypothetical protein